MSNLSPTQTKIEPTMSILVRHKLSAPCAVGGGGGGNAAPSESGHEKTPHPRKGRGSARVGLCDLESDA
jgi:hypothetical protein